MTTTPPTSRIRRLSLGLPVAIETPPRPVLVMDYAQQSGARRRRSRRDSLSNRGGGPGRSRSSSRGGGGQRTRRLGPGQHWLDIAPMRKSDREAMDPQCFAVPEFLMYPMCPNGSRQITQQGVRAAIRRARMEIVQFPNDPVHREALRNAMQEARRLGMTEGRRPGSVKRRT